ncbi:MAG: undecaprenyl-diphosphate phosphatase [Nitriliruptoraceae bacterium]|nr:undecaprenyl-diphosphate phosphatase [Nitriliruptoraceae bacterium]
MGLVVALVLGVVQGVFMFVPVSSTSHLVLSQTLLRERGIELPPPDSPELILFDLVVHVGTLVSVVIVMGDGLKELWQGVRTDVQARRAPTTPEPALAEGTALLPDGAASRLVGLMVLSVAVTGALGLVFQDLLTTVFGSPQLVAAALFVTGAMLWWTDAMTPARSGRRLRFGWRGPTQVTLGVAVLLGVAQAVALTPGISRSGTTIFVALLLGMQRTLAARYSFYIAIPTILAATGVQALQVWLGDGFGTISWSAMAIGFVSAAVVGTAALWVVLRLLEAARFRAFAIYVWGLASVVLFTGLS